MRAVPLQEFQHQARLGSGEFRLGGDDALHLQRHRGGFVGRFVRWLRGLVTAPATTSAARESTSRASRAFLDALKAQYGSETAASLCERTGLSQDKPLSARMVQQAVKTLQRTHAQKLRGFISEVTTQPASGLDFLQALSRADLIRNPLTADVLRTSKKLFPPNTVADGVRSFLAEGSTLSPLQVDGIVKALTMATQNDSPRGVLEQLRLTGCLQDTAANQNVSRLLAHILPALKFPSEHTAAFLNLMGEGALETLHAPTMRLAADGRLRYDPPSPSARQVRTALMENLKTTALEHPVRSIAQRHIKPHIQRGKLDAQGFVRALPDTAFARALKSELAENPNCHIQRKDCSNSAPAEVVERLWAASGKNAKAFATLCNLLTPQVFDALRSALWQSGQNEHIGAVDGWAMGADWQQQHRVYRAPNGVLTIETARTQAHQAGDDITCERGTREPLHLTHRNTEPMEFTKTEGLTFTLNDEGVFKMATLTHDAHLSARLVDLEYQSGNGATTGATNGN